MYATDDASFPMSNEKDNGAGEMKCYKNFSDSNTAASYAFEIVNEIVEKAMNIANMDMEMNTQKIEKINPSVVGNIIDNILSKTSDSPDHNTFPEDETVLLDDEIKKIINEMKCPIEQKPLTGVGDQLLSKSETMLPDKILELPKRNTLERKGRLTNLVRNSKHIFTKLVSDNDKRASSSNLEDTNEEKLVKVIDFECGIMGDNVPFQMQADDTFTDPTVFPYSQDTSMEVVDLDKTMEGSPNDGTMKLLRTIRKDEVLDQKRGIGNRRRWNFGSRILRYFRKKSKVQQKETSQDT